MAAQDGNLSFNSIIRAFFWSHVYIWRKLKVNRVDTVIFSIDFNELCDFSLLVPWLVGMLNKNIKSRLYYYCIAEIELLKAIVFN